MVQPAAAAAELAPAAGGLTDGVVLVSQRQRAFRTFVRNRAAVIGVVLIGLIVLVAIAAPLLAPHDPYAQSTTDRLASPSADYLLGRDDFGRDVVSRIIYGARLALLVGFASVAMGGTLGTTIGLIAGYFGGKIEAVLMRIVDVMLSFPDLITGLLVLAVLDAGLTTLIFAIGLTITPRFARLAHGPTLSVKQKEFVEAARAVGARNGRIVSRHILPNIAGELLVLASLWTAQAIRLEASLSFIGVGLDPRIPTWGGMIRGGTVYLPSAPWLALAPGAALLIAVFAFNLVGDGLRDILDPRSR